MLLSVVALGPAARADEVESNEAAVLVQQAIALFRTLAGRAVQAALDAHVAAVLHTAVNDLGDRVVTGAALAGQ